MEICKDGHLTLQALLSMLRNFIQQKKSLAEWSLGIFIEQIMKRCALDLELDGLEVYDFSVKRVPVMIKELLDSIDRTAQNYDYFVMHQANKIMNETIRKKIGFSADQTPYSLKNYGNTSSASIPLTICSELNNSLKVGKNRMLLSGFGVGLSWGAVDLELNNCICLPIIEV